MFDNIPDSAAITCYTQDCTTYHRISHSISRARVPLSGEEQDSRIEAAAAASQNERWPLPLQISCGALTNKAHRDHAHASSTLLRSRVKRSQSDIRSHYHQSMNALADRTLTPATSRPGASAAISRMTARSTGAGGGSRCSAARRWATCSWGRIAGYSRGGKRAACRAAWTAKGRLRGAPCFR